MLKVGSVAPGFEATLSDGTPFRLSDYRGQKNVVLYFYPKAFTGGCTAEACSMRDNYGPLSQHDAVIFGVSADQAENQTAFREQYSLPFPMISDPEKDVLRLYDTLAFGGHIRLRVTYVIDKAGIIRAVIHHDLRVDRHVPDILDALDNIAASAA